MREGPHEALKRVAEGDRAGGLEALVVSVRRFEADKAGSGIDALCHLLYAYPDLRAALRTALRELLADDTAASLYADTGVLANTGFFTELGRRLTGRLLPAPRDLTLLGIFGTIFDSGNDAELLPRLPPADGVRVLRALRLDEDPAREWRGARNALLDALDLLSVRVAALGVEPELRRHYRVPREHDNPFLAQNALLQGWLADARTTGDTTLPDAQDVGVLLSQCLDVLDRVRRSARAGGASLRLTFLLQRLRQMLSRMASLLAITAGLGRDDDAALAARVSLAVELALAEGNGHDIHEHLADSTSLLALLVTENASRTGEHYITRTRAEYVAMFRSALGAGGIIGVMAIMKTLLAALHLPSLIEALAFSLNYAVGFVLIYALHFTIATKQPAMTAQTLATSLSSATGRRVDTDAASLLFSRVSRTQLVAVAGNVLLAMPVALALTLLLMATGSGIPAQKTPHLLADIHPFAGPTLFFAAIAGVWLFVSGLVTGYVDNLATYERLADRVRRMRRVGELLGEARHERFAVWLEANLGGVAGNVFFGFALGMTGFFGDALGLPLDIRHVTFAAANLAVAVGATGFTLPVGIVLTGLCGVALIALVNLAVSFTLALYVALRARGETLRARPLLAALSRRFREDPRSFIWPPRHD